MGSRKKIAIIGGDGIGPSVTEEAKKLLEIYRDKAGLPLDLWELDLGADRFLRDGTTFPKEIQVAIQRECAAGSADQKPADDGLPATHGRAIGEDYWGAEPDQGGPAT